MALNATVALLRAQRLKRQAKQVSAVRLWQRVKSEAREFIRDTVKKS